MNYTLQQTHKITLVTLMMNKLFCKKMLGNAFAYHNVIHEKNMHNMNIPKKI